MKKLLLAAATVALTSVAWTPLAFAQVANDEQTLALAATLDNNSFDRAQLMIANQIQYWQPVLDTLLIAEPDGTIVPGLATEWSYNGDNRILSLALRDGVEFTDGTPFDADAVKANIEYLRNGAGQNSFMAALISEIEIVSPLEVRLHLSEPDPTLLDNLTVVGGAMASPATLGAEGSGSILVGTGPYLYDSNTSALGRQYVYNRNPDHWEIEQYPFERITISPINDNVARINALKSGQIDGALSEARAVADAQANGLTINSSDVNWMGLTIADRDGKLTPALGDVRVRQAINMAFDKASILEFLELGYGRLSDQIFPTGSEAYVEELDSVYPYDPEAARALLAEAGYADGFEVLMPDIAQYASFNPIIETQLKDVGITVRWEKIAPNATITELRSGRFPLFMLPFGYQGSWAEYRKFALPESPWNPIKVADATLLEMLDEVQYASGEAQVEGYKELNRYLVDNAWFAPWYRRDTFYFTNAQTTAQMRGTNGVPFIRDYGKAE